jgi:hypothetical protein
MKTYVKIMGPPLGKAIKALENISIKMPHVCIMDSYIASSEPMFNTQEGIMNYFSSIGGLTEERCNTIIDKSQLELGEYDFSFNWYRTPTLEDYLLLIQKIDRTLKPLGVRYNLHNDHYVILKKDARASDIDLPFESEPFFEVIEDKAGGFRFRLKAPNHEIIAVSESYESIASCMNGIEVVKKLAADAPLEEYEEKKGLKLRARFEIYTDKGGEYRFRLVAANNEIVAVSSQGYSSSSDRMKGIESVKRNASAAEVLDLTSTPF